MVVGIIAEYNPFHNGHAYQIEEIKRQTGASHVIIAMSGDFVQRGCPAICDKYTRAKQALSCGADLVIELPATWATASAEYFATAGVNLLGSTGVVDVLCYGMEGTNQDHMDRDYAMLKALVEVIQKAPTAYDEAVASYQKQGLAYPHARAAALSNFTSGFDNDLMVEFLAKPNNILAIEYEKALATWNQTANHPIKSCPIKRTGNYHDTNLEGDFASATAIRHLFSQEEIEESELQSALQKAVPETVVLELLEAYKEGRLVSDNAISGLLYYKLLSLQKEGYEDFADCSKALSDKIKKNLSSYTDFRSFCDLLKSKDLTYTRISRVLIHILLDIRKKDYDRINFACPVPYLRVLGFRKDATDLLSEIKKSAAIPLITKMADAKDILPAEDFLLLEKDIFASELYRSLSGFTSDKNEFTHGPVIR